MTLFSTILRSNRDCGRRSTCSFLFQRPFSVQATSDLLSGNGDYGESPERWLPCAEAGDEEDFSTIEKQHDSPIAMYGKAKVVAF